MYMSIDIVAVHHPKEKLIGIYIYIYLFFVITSVVQYLNSMRKQYLFQSAQSCNQKSAASTLELGDGALDTPGGGGNGGIGAELTGSLDTFGK